ncbi:MAG: radical SAM/SPASM domain-containing protein [Candidatus Scalindua sp.]
MPSDWAFISVDMELTNRCSTDCIMCPRDAITRPKGMMSECVFKAVSEKLVSEGSLITFSGMGDPLSHPNVFEWICEIRRKDGDVGIVINPTSLNKEISQKLIEARPNSITLSFPSIRKKVFERLCPKVSYDDALKRTLELIDLARGNVGLRATGIITDINSGEQEENVSFWRGWGVGSSMTVCHGRGGNLRAPGVYEPQSIGVGSGMCSLFQFHTFVTWEGEVLACCHDLTGTTRIGSLVNDDVSIIAERKRKVLKDSMPFSVCGQCDEPLRQCQTPQGLPPEGRKERNRFFRSVSQEKIILPSAKYN